VEERRLRLWLSDAPLQGQIAARAVAGALPATPQAVGDVVVNASGSKLDYYLDRRLEYTPGCGGRSRLALTLVNGAPTTGLPDYVTPERLRPGRPPGTNRLIVTLYLPGSAGDVRLSVDGKPVALLQGTELGLTWAETTVDLLPGQRQVVQAEFSGAGSDAVERVVQPLVRPETFSAGSC
jgi:hypothetical protein